MGAAELWTSDASFYTFTDSTNLNPEKGCINLMTRTSDGKEFINPLDKTPEKAPVHLVASMMSITMCNNSTISRDPETQAWKTTGDPTEVCFTFIYFNFIKDCHDYCW